MNGVVHLAIGSHVAVDHVSLIVSIWIINMGMHLGHAHTHDVLRLDMQADLPRRNCKNFLDHEINFQTFSEDKFLHIANESCLNLLAKAIIFTDRFDEASHELISLVLEKFMASGCRFQTLFEGV